jgi:hypothetical protein
MPFVTTKLVLDIATGKILHIDGYEYTGPVELACGASDEERSLERSQHDLFKQIIQDFQVQFGKQNNILDSLTSIMTPIAQPCWPTEVTSPALTNCWTSTTVHKDVHNPDTRD